MGGLADQTAVLVTGGTGTTGARVAAQLRGEGWPVRIASRHPARGDRSHVRFDWAAPATHQAALAGVDRVYLVAPVGVPDPTPLVEPFLAAAIRQGVRRVVLLSSSAIGEDTPGPGALHRLVREVAPEWAVLRPSWFMQNFLGHHPVGAGIRDRCEIVTATGDGRIPFVDAADIAAVAVRALLDAVPYNADYVITGPQAMSYAEAAEIITATAKRPIRHRSVSPTELATRLIAAGYAPGFARVLAALDEAVRRGAEDRVTAAVPAITRRRARSFREFVLAHRTAFTGDTRT